MYMPPKTVPSSLFCDIVGDCSIGSCLNLADNFAKEERQIAYLVFEQLAGWAHLLKASARATQLAGDYTIRQTDWLVSRFSSAMRVEQALKTEALKKKIGLAAGIAYALLGAGALTIPPIGSVAAAFAISNPAATFVLNSYVGANAIVNAASPEVPDITGNLESWLTHTLNKIIHERAINIDYDLRDLMTGNPNHMGMTILDLLLSKDFLAPDSRLQIFLLEKEESYLFAVAVNAVWRIDRPYINWSESPSGCSYERRGHPNYLVGLPEYPNKSFWMYAIGQGRENDWLKDDQAQINGPSGLKRFHKETKKSYYITREDIVRSSLFVHRHKLDNAINGLDVPGITGALRNEGVNIPSMNHDWTPGPSKPHLGKVPSAFSIPICRNPGGESISSVWEDKSRNYPCMCGEFGWNHGWAIEKDKTFRFLELTGFIFSEDREDYCSDYNKCKGENSIDWHSAWKARREKDDPPISRKLKHPFNRHPLRTKSARTKLCLDFVLF